MIDLCQFLLKGGRQWDQIVNMLKRVSDEDFQDAAVKAGRYIAGAMTHARSEKSAKAAWQLLEALVFPAATYDRKIAFLAAIGRTLWS